jgi:hypothetical protein
MGKTKKKKSRPSGYSVFLFELFKKNRMRFNVVQEANELADREWRKLPQPEKDRSDEVKQQTSALPDSKTTPIFLTCSDTMTRRSDAGKRRPEETSTN